MLQVLTSPKFSDAAQQKKWSDHVKQAWTGFLELLFNYKLTEKNEKEIELIDYYQNQIKHLRPKLMRDKVGKLVVQGLDFLKGQRKS